jgi:hypothetical protein
MDDREIIRLEQFRQLKKEISDIGMWRVLSSVLNRVTSKIA